MEKCAYPKLNTQKEQREASFSVFGLRCGCDGEREKEQDPDPDSLGWIRTCLGLLGTSCVQNKQQDQSLAFVYQLQLFFFFFSASPFFFAMRPSLGRRPVHRTL